MDRAIRVGLIGDFNPKNKTHIATNDGLHHAAAALDVSVEPIWLPTPSLDDAAYNAEATLKSMDALWCAPASPYESMSGALRGIRFAREQDWPFIGT
jgi:CTP synthase (UTP-ammonia lyase)